MAVKARADTAKVSDVETTTTAYGAAGSLIVVLVWIYYTAAILYFGAEFTQAYANHFGVKIEPADYAVYVEQIERERDVAVIPTQEKVEGKRTASL